MYPITNEQLMGLVDQATNEWSECVVPIFVESKKSNEAANEIGSAYLCGYGQNILLVTALHVVTAANKHNFQVANICGKAVDIGGLPFHALQDHDIAIASLEEDWLLERGVKKIKATPVGRDLTEWQRTGIFVAIGYPGTKNKLDMRYEKVDRNCLGISVVRLKECKVKTPVKDAMFLSYDHDNVINSSGVKLGAQPDLYGMSGGPCLELLRRNGQEPMFSFDPVGVLSEWHKDDRVIVAAPLPQYT